MQTLETITLRHLLPLVFKGMEGTERIVSSQVWLVPELTFRRGCRLCVQAESGGGKSSLLSFIYGNRSDYSGTLLFNERNAQSLTVDDWCDVRVRHLSLLPQEMRLFPELTVMQNIQMKNQLSHHKTEQQILALLERLGIAEKANERLGLLSIGQQQRVAAIRAVCQPFDFILLDEPVSHLDKNNNQEIARIVDEEATAQGAGVVSTSVGNPLLLPGATFISL